MTFARLLCLVVIAGAVVAFQARAAEVIPPLIEAVRVGDRSRALTLIESGSDADAATADGTTALHWAARTGAADLAALLIGAGASADPANRYGVTPLQLAAVNGDAAMLGLLLDAGADPNARLPEGETILMSAARTGVPAALTALLARGADVDARESWYGESALMWAAAEDHADAVRTLVEAGADVDSRSRLMEFERRRAGQSILPLGSWTPLMYAARENALEAGNALIEAGANPDLVDPDGATALVLAIINAHYEFAAMLLDAGADPNVVDNDAGMGPLYAAVDMHTLAVGHGRGNPLLLGSLDAVDIARQLLERGADPNARLRQRIMQRQHTIGDTALGEGATPLLRAAKSGDIEMVRLLVAAGAEPTATLPNGMTALMFAAGLAWRDGSPIAPSYDQGTEADAVETLRFLLELGLDIDARNEAGDTALHAAAGGRGSAEIVAFLIERGADTTLTNAREQTAFAIAESRGRAQLAAIIAAGRDPGD